MPLYNFVTKGSVEDDQWVDVGGDQAARNVLVQSISELLRDFGGEGSRRLDIHATVSDGTGLTLYALTVTADGLFTRNG